MITSGGSGDCGAPALVWSGGRPRRDSAVRRTAPTLHPGPHGSQSPDRQAGLDWERRTSSKYASYNPRRDVVVADNDMKDRKVDERSAFLQLAWSPSRWRFLV